MSIFSHGDICRHICRYLSFQDMCMFRRCTRHLRIFISGNFLYDRKTTYLGSMYVGPSQIMGFTTDINYRRYLKKRGWRAICPSYYLPLRTSNIALTRYLMRTLPDKLYGEDYGFLMKAKDRELIDLSVKLTRPDQLVSLFKEILLTEDDELIQWFEDKHVGDQLEALIVESRPTTIYHASSDVPIETIWKRYGARYRSLFQPRRDKVTGMLITADVVFALERKILSRRINKIDVNSMLIYHVFGKSDYIEEDDCFVKRD